MLDRLEDFVAERGPDEDEPLRSRDEPHPVGLALDVGIDQAADPEAELGHGALALEHEEKCLHN